MASIITSSALDRLSKQRQFPISVTNVLKQRSYANEHAESGEKKEKKEMKRKKKELEAEVQPEQTTPSKILAAVNITIGKLTEVEVTPVETHPSGATEKQSITLSEEQVALVSLALEGHNIFYTGPAGCGKSRVLKAIRNRFKAKDEHVHVLAPTGKVALANKGRTIWSFAGWTPNSHKMKLYELINPVSQRNIALFGRLAEVKTIIIDEISMVESVHFGRLNELMKAAKQSPLPFGGIQVIVTGDFCQLPPVKPFRNCFSCGSQLESSYRSGTYACLNQNCVVDVYHEDDKWAFKSKAWQECNFRYIYLATVYRQRDPVFTNLLQMCRLGVQFDDADIKLLTSPDKKTSSHPVKLFPTRAEIREVNDAEFRRLDIPSQVYKCVDVFLWNKKRHPYLQDKLKRAADGSLKVLSDHSFEVELQLKEGMQVLLLYNLDLENELCNGTQGKIIAFQPFGKSLPEIPLYGEDLPVYMSGLDEQKEAIREFMRKCCGAEGWPVVEFHNGIVRTIYPVCQPLLLGEKRPYSLIGRMQIPLTAAWALSIHKSQGMTLDSAVVSIGKAFEEGQIYVALSRVKELAGLKVEGDLSPLREFKGDRVVLEWLKKTFGEKVVMGK